MNRNRQTLDDKLSLLRSYAPSRRLFTREEIQQHLEGSGKRGDGVTAGDPSRGIVVGITAAILLAGSALVYMNSGDDAPAIAAGLKSVVRQQGEVQRPVTSTDVVQADGGKGGNLTRFAEGEPPSPLTERVEGKETGGREVGGRKVGEKNTDTVRPAGNAGTAARIPADTAVKIVFKDKGRRIDSVPGIITITHTQYSPEEVARQNASFDDERNIDGLRALELTRPELECLGIHFNGSGIDLAAEERYVLGNMETMSPSNQLAYDADGTEIRHFNISIDTFRITDMSVTNPSCDGVSRIAPVAVMSRWVKDALHDGSSLLFFDRSPLLTTVAGSPRRMLDEMYDLYNIPSADSSHRHGADRFPLMSKLVPVHVSMQGEEINGTRKRQGGDIYIWYVPTREFVAALPDRYRGPLRKELDVIADVESQHLPPAQVCERLTGASSFLDYCRRGCGALVRSSVYPNPAVRNVAVNYLLIQPRHVSITLHDITGTFLRELASAQERGTGEQSQQVDLGQLPQGTYLIAIHTNAGEQSVQRVIVQ